MKLAVMQPYFYPYIGYFNLIETVDQFVLFDHVQYKRGWINRNKIKNGFITVPVRKSPQKTPIAEIKIAEGNWHKKHCASLLNCYGKNTKNHPIFEFYSRLKIPKLLSSLLASTLENTCNYLEIETDIVSSSDYQLESLDDPLLSQAEEAVLQVCISLGATTYFNPVGGQSLYDESNFKRYGIDLKFMEPVEGNTLSILDLCLGDGYEGNRSLR
jgi:hypothetical protein